MIQIKCVGCGHREETDSHMQPFCPFCGSPMIAVSASTKPRKSRKKPQDTLSDQALMRLQEAGSERLGGGEEEG